MAQENAATRYLKKTVVLKTLKLNRNTDKAILEHLETVDNFCGYIKSLILRDIESKRENAQ